MILFSEKQRFTQWWLWLILVIVLLDPMYLLLKDPASQKDLWFFFSLIIPVLVIVLFRLLCLETRIYDEAIQFRFLPFQQKFRNISKVELSKVYVKKYRPLIDYGGWGIRWSLFGKGRAYNVSGNKGIQIECKDGRKILIGTRQPEQVTQILFQAGFPDNSNS